MPQHESANRAEIPDSEQSKAPVSRTALVMLIIGIVIIVLCLCAFSLYWGQYEGHAHAGKDAIADFRPGGKVKGGFDGTFSQAWVSWNQSSQTAADKALGSAVLMLCCVGCGIVLVVFGLRNLRKRPVEPEEEDVDFKKELAAKWAAYRHSK